MNRNAGRYTRNGQDRTWFEYRDVLPNTPEEVAKLLGISLRNAERDLRLCKGLGLVKQVGETYEVTQSPGA